MSDGQTPRPDLHIRLLLLLFVLTIGCGLMLLAFFVSPREVRASRDGLRLKMWFGWHTHVPSERILGVRLYHRRQAVEVVQRGRASLYLSASSVFSPWSPDMGHALIALFGQTQEDRDYELGATGPDITARATRPAEFHVKPPAVWRRVHALLALLLAAAAAVGWRSITLWLVDVQVRDGSPLLFGALLAFALGCFVLLGLVDAWFLFLSNRTTGVTISDAGIILRRSRGERTIPANEVAGVEVRRTRNARGPEIHVHLVRGGGIVLHERVWAAEPGVIAGVLMHRFGQWDAGAAHRLSRSAVTA